MYKLLLIIPFLFFGCDGGMSIFYSNENSNISCGDPTAMNYEYGTGGQYYYITNGCIYCEEIYTTEWERFEYCCCNTGAENYNENTSCYSTDNTYCIFE